MRYKVNGIVIDAKTPDELAEYPIQNGDIIENSIDGFLVKPEDEDHEGKLIKKVMQKLSEKKNVAQEMSIEQIF